MSADRRKVSAEQLRILIEELEKDRTLVSGRAVRSASTKLDHLTKWEELAKKLNTVEDGTLKNVTKWQQSLRDWKSNTKKKAAKLSESNQELTSLELRLLAIYEEDITQAKTVGIDISSITEIDPLSSEENSCDDVVQFPDTFTTYSAPHLPNVTPPSETEDVEFKVKRRRVQVLSDDVIRQQNNILARLTALEATRQESQNRQNELLEAVASAVDRHAAATARLADLHARAVTRILDVLDRKHEDG